VAIDKITEKIIAENEIEINEILSKAQAHSKQIIDDANKAAEKVEAEIFSKAQKTAEGERARIISMADSEIRKINLSNKQKLIDLCFSRALDKLLNLKQDEYIELLTDMIAYYIKNGKEEILLGKNDALNIGDKMLAQLKNKISQQKPDIDFNVVISKHTLLKDGGFILKDGNVEINNTFEMIILNQKEEILKELADVLFA
jgi:V/A-type H+-transporting ATPase subunit E